MKKYKCVDPFVFFTAEGEKFYAADVEVEDGDPILQTHAASFASFDAPGEVFRPLATVEEATAEPGEKRSVSTVKRGPGRPRKDKDGDDE